MPESVLFWIVAATAVAIVGLSKSGLGGGVGMVAVPMLSLVMSPRDAAGMMLPLLLVMDAIAVWTYRRDADWNIIRIMVPGAAIGTLLGWFLWASISDAAVLLVVGIISLLFVLDSVFPIRKRLVGRPPSRPWGTFWGAVAGTTSFVSHAGGPPYQIYVLPRRLPPVNYAATTAWFFAIVNAMKLPPYFMLGQLSVSNLTLGALLAPVAVAGVLLGVLAVRRIPVTLFYRIAYALIFLLSLKMIHDGITGLIAGPPAT